MVIVGRPFTFREDDPRPMLCHLDAWARRSLNSPEPWSSMLERCDQWLDYSPRNQVLLASYGVVGRVAGVATWDRVPSSEPGRGCAVRSGEHGLPVRVPVVEAAAVSSSRSRAQVSSESVAGGHRWELVFAEEQLARRPGAGAIESVAVPRMSEKRWNEVVRQATGRMTGRTPRKVSDPTEQLVALAAAVPSAAGRFALDGVLADQASSLAAGRVGMADRPMLAFEPDGLTGRERWRTLVDVRHAATRVVDALSFAVEVELRRSPLPRHEVVDDREVPAWRRNYLAPADLRAMPLGVWIEAGHAAIPDDAWLVVRGVASIEPETSRRQAELFRPIRRLGPLRVVGAYARSDDEVLDLAEDRLDAFATLFVYRLADVIDAGLEVVPTYRSPHVTITFYDDVDIGVARLLAVSHRTVTNPAFGRSVLDWASDPEAVVPGAVLVAGRERFWSVVRIEQVDDDGQVHFAEVADGHPDAVAVLQRSSAPPA